MKNYFGKSAREAGYIVALNDMEKNVNDVLLKNVAILSKHSEKEDSMMPEGSSPMPSVEYRRYS